MNDFLKHIIYEQDDIRGALSKLNFLGADAILFVVNSDKKLLGSLTDGDIRRGFIKGLDFHHSLLDFVQPQPIFINRSNYSLVDLEKYRKNNLKVIPILDDANVIVDVLNLRLKRSLLPVDALIMAGGRGLRLMPLTENCPKPLIKIGDKAIIDHNIDRLISYGVDNIHVSINYLGDMIKSWLGTGEERGARFSYVEEEEPLGTMGAARLVSGFRNDDILLMNSDLLTNIDFVDFYLAFTNSGADMAVATTNYHVDVPYAVLETNGDNTVRALVEKPTYTYYSNAGIYLIKRKLFSLIPEQGAFDTPDFMKLIIEKNFKVVTYHILDYWLDIGKMRDYHKAQEDIKHIHL